MTIRTLRLIRWTALAAIAIVALSIAIVELVPGVHQLVQSPADEPASSPAGDAVTVPAGVSIGGPFKLTNNQDHAVTDADYRGRWMLVFFGYSNCPDDCPLTLQKMATTLKDLGPLADRVAPLFITVDPAHDTPSRLTSYLENFDVRIIGLTGSDEQIAAVAKAYRVYYSPDQNEQSGADLINHSTFLYLMNPNGKLAALFPQDVTADKLTAALRARLSASKQSARSDPK
jgi:cytochrome oxidase Cu insertion factor (SCO1/SenC/PrrC family)